MNDTTTMNEFTRNKIAFAIALLATLFTISPLTSEFGSSGFFVAGLFIQIRHLYYFLAMFLTLAVYCYGVQFLTERPLRVFQRLADICYAAAILAPPAYLCLYLIMLLADSIGTALKSQAAPAYIQNIMSAVLGVIASLAVRELMELFARKETKSQIRQLELEEFAILTRARQLFFEGQYDLCIVECFKAIEVTLRKAFLDRAIPAHKKPILGLIEAAAREGILPKDLVPGVLSIRDLRNKAAHAVERVSKADAAQGLDLAGRVLAAIAAALGNESPGTGHGA